MKKALRITGMILLCMLIGYGIGIGLGHILGDGSDGESIEKMKMAEAVVISFAALVVGGLLLYLKSLGNQMTSKAFLLGARSGSNLFCNILRYFVLILNHSNILYIKH